MSWLLDILKLRYGDANDAAGNVKSCVLAIRVRFHHRFDFTLVITNPVSEKVQYVVRITRDDGLLIYI